MPAACLITFRASGAERVRNLHFVLRWLDTVPGLETLVLEQDREPTLHAEALPASCRLLFAHNGGAFNKSWGLNVAFRASDADVVAVSDADLVVDRDRIRQALDACRGGYELVRPWSDVVDLTEEETGSLAGGELDESAVRTPERLGRHRVGEHPPLCGGMYVTRRDVYERLGGQDERFSGWGGEDDAMSLKVAAMCSRVGVLRDSVALHLCHPRHASLPVDDPDYRRNVMLLQEYQRLSRDEFIGMCEHHRQHMGEAERFNRR